MRIFLIWFGLICCGIANGLFFNLHEEIDGMFIAMGVSCVVSIYLLYLHRKITKDWERYPDPWTGYRIPIFSLTLFFSLFAFVFLQIIPESYPPATVTSITIAVTSFIAFLREKDYTEEI